MRSGNITVTDSKLTVVQFTSSTSSGGVGAVQANRPVPTSCLIYYFEVYVKSGGELGRIGVGFADNNFNTTRQPG
jgi:hypothetical protein